MEISSTIELEEYISKVLEIPYVNLNGIDSNIIIQIAEALSNCFNKYPALKGTICAVGSGKDINNQYNLVDTLKGKSKCVDFVMQDPMALMETVALGSHGFVIMDKKIIGLWKYIAIAYSDKLKSSNINEQEEQSRMGAELGIFTRHSINFKSKIYHEIGHVLDFVMNISHSKEFIKIVEPEVQHLYEKLSEYSLHSVRDILAEAFAEYMMCPDSNDLVISIGKLIDDKYKKYENSRIFRINDKYKKSLIDENNKNIRR